MKKFVSVLLSLTLVFCALSMFVGCQKAAVSVFAAGMYETYEEINDEPFSKAKIRIQPISNEEFEKANGVNVIKNGSKNKENKIYYSIELSLYDIDKEAYLQAKIFNLAHNQDCPPNLYGGTIESEYFDCVFHLDYGQSQIRIFYFDINAPYKEHSFILKFVS